MNTNALRSIAVCLSVVLLTSVASAGDPLRIMPLGDSITAGYTDNPSWANHPFEFGYRSGLYSLLTDAGYNFEFVGGSQEPWNNLFGDPSHGGTYTPPLDLRALGQNGHRGYGGAGAIYLNANIAGWLAADDPDIILLMIGTNGQDIAGLNSLVNNIVDAQPNAQLVVAEIIPYFNYSNSVVSYNSYIRNTLVPAHQALGHNVTSVNQYANFLTAPGNLASINQSLFSNGINHPSNAGYDLMAQTWFDAIELLPPPSGGDPSDPPIVIQTNTTSMTELAFASDVSTSDLIEGITPIPSGPAWNTSPSSMTDGQHGGSFFDVGRVVEGAWTAVGASVEYHLGLGDNGLGYDLHTIQSIAAWESAGFGNQVWTVEVKPVGGDYALLATVNYQPIAVNGSGASKVILNGESGVLATGIESIRFIAGAQNSHVSGTFVWRELDVFGTPTAVPEPSAIVVGLLAILAGIVAQPFTKPSSQYQDSESWF